MKVFGRYFAHHAKGTLPRFLIIVVLTLIFLLPRFINEPVFYISYDYTDRDICNTYASELADKLNGITVIACILCTVIPILEFAGFYNRKNADTMLSLPISRPKLALVHFLNGAWQLVALLSCYIIIYANITYQYGQKCYGATGYFLYGDMKMFIPYYFAAILSALFVYSFFVLVFNFANNIADGVVFVLAYIFAGMLFEESVFGLFCLHNFLSWSEIELLPYTLILEIDASFFDGLVNDMFMLDSAFKNGWMLEHMITPIIISVVGILVLLGCFVLHFTYKKAEKLEGISNFPLGYALLIPLYGMSFSAIMFDVSFDIQSSAVVIIPMVIAYMIYRRSFKLKVFDLVMIVLTVGVMLAANPIHEYFIMFNSVYY